MDKSQKKPESFKFFNRFLFGVTPKIILFQKMPRHRILGRFQLRYDVIRDDASINSNIYSNL